VITHRKFDIKFRMDDEHFRIGCWISAKKKNKINFQLLMRLCEESGVHIVELNMEKPMESQGPFDLILQKLDDITATRNAVQTYTRKFNLQKFIESHPEVPILNSLSKSQQLEDRRNMNARLKTFEGRIQDIDIFVPSFVELRNSIPEDCVECMHEAGVTFPCVCKPFDATHPDTSHDMSLVFEHSGLRDVKTPCMAQSFINHDGILYKLFIVGPKTFITRRPSIKNLNPGEYKTEHFRTADVSKPNSSSHLNQFVNNDQDESSVHQLDLQVMTELAQTVRNGIGIDLLGIDVIVESKTNRHAIIDVNPFPGYDGVPHIQQMLCDYMIDTIRSTRSKQS